MSKELCTECGRKRDPFAAVVKTTDGLVHWVCRQCYKKLDFKDFMHPQNCQCDHCRSQRS